MARVNSLDIGKEMCKIFGIDSEYVRDIDIYIHADDYVRVVVRRTMTDKESGKIKEFFSKYRLYEYQSRELPDQQTGKADTSV